MYPEFINDIKLPKTLNLPKNATFGVEIEFENAPLSIVEDKLNQAKKSKILLDDWQLKQDDSLYSYGSSKKIGGELTSPVLKDEIDTYKQIRNACHVIKSANGIITSKCGGHIHVGANILNDDVKNYSRLARLWTVFEDEIVRFGLGEDEEPRDSMSFYAGSSANLLKHIDLLESENFGEYDFANFVRCYGIEKKLALSFFYLNEDKPFHTLEFRCPNGTLNPIIWKNNINFFVKLLEACKNSKKDWHMIERMFLETSKNTYDDYTHLENNMEIDKALLLAKFVFDSQLDINNFMVQYKKDDAKIMLKKMHG